MNPAMRKMWYCPVCFYVMTEDESKGYAGCPTDKPEIVVYHLAQHVELNLPELLHAKQELERVLDNAQHDGMERDLNT